MKIKSSALIGFVIFIIIIGALILQANGGLPFLDQWLANLNPFKPSPRIFTFGDAIITDIQQVSRLTTTIYTIQQVTEGGTKRDDCHPINVLGRDYWMIMVVKGRIEAGLDLAQLNVSDVSVSEDGKSITVNLPPVTIHTKRSQILSSNKEGTYVYDHCREGLVGNKDNDLQSKLLIQAGGEILATACADDILTKANEDAKLAIEQFLNIAHEDFNINIVSAAVPPCPPPGY
jgi:hypothetical protein